MSRVFELNTTLSGSSTKSVTSLEAIWIHPHVFFESDFHSGPAKTHLLWWKVNLTPEVNLGWWVGSFWHLIEHNDSWLAWWSQLLLLSRRRKALSYSSLYDKEKMLEELRRRGDSNGGILNANRRLFLLAFSSEYDINQKLVILSRFLLR